MTVPLAMAFVNALLLVSLARELLRGRRFLVFWAFYATAWVAIAWHGAHFHRPPRPAALFMNLDEIAGVPWPGWSEIPWALVAVAVAVGCVARGPSPRRRELRVATGAVAMAFAIVHGAALVRYRTADMLRYSEYGDLVRTQGLEGAMLLDSVELLSGPDAAGILRDLRVDMATHPPVQLPLDPIPVERVVLVQIESLDRDAVTAEGTPYLFGLGQTATVALLNTMRTSVSGSSSADFQLLTGLRPRAGVPAYRLQWDRDPSGLPAYAAARGFAFHAYHGNDRHFWNRGPFFAAAGVRFHSAESIPETEFSRWGRADGDLFRYAATAIRTEGRAVHFLITLSTHAPYDLVQAAGSADVKTRYLRSMAYVDAALGTFLRQLPNGQTTLVGLYSDHTSGLFDSAEEVPVPLILGRLAADGTLAPLARAERPVHEIDGTFEIAALHRFVKDCLDASPR